MFIKKWIFIIYVFYSNILHEVEYDTLSLKPPDSRFPYNYSFYSAGVASRIYFSSDVRHKLNFTEFEWNGTTSQPFILKLVWLHHDGDEWAGGYELLTEGKNEDNDDL